MAAAGAEEGPGGRPVRTLKGVGPRRAALLTRLGIATIEDLLLHFPRAYLDRTQVLPLSDLRPETTATTIAEVVRLAVRRPRGRARDVVARLRDGSGEIDAVWFNAAYLARLLHPGDRLLLSGRVTVWRGLQLSHPEFEILPPDSEGEGEAAGRIVPVYPSTAGLGQRALRSMLAAALEQTPSIHDPLPVALLERFRFPSRRESLRMIHLPATSGEAERGRSRLAFEELFFLQILLLRARAVRRTPGTAYPLAGATDRLEAVRRAFPFRLTEGQEEALHEILDDLGHDYPALRLMQGEVGSGKTAVAAMACAWAAGAGSQSGVLLPTEVLARQQHEVLSGFLGPAGCAVALLTGRTPAAERKGILEELEQGRTDVLVGTHAVLEKDVRFRRLGLVVVDEQHRFGVLQRLRLVEKGPSPHLLVMSATPIPRTMALALHGDLDITTIRGIPPGRTPVTTRLVDRTRWDEMMRFIAERLRRGQQAFFVYPLVEESERVDLRDATRMHGEIAGHPAFRGLEIALLHGRTPSKEREATLRGLALGKIAGLVATTVIEVGIDLPRATVMVIEHPERFGLLQLHQLRGRIGRAPGEPPYLFLIRDEGPIAGAPERLSVLTRESDGFRIAEEDLRLRGPGELIGTRQAGFPGMRVSDLARDGAILHDARAVAEAILKQDAALETEENRILWKEVLRWNPEGLRLLGVA